MSQLFQKISEWIPKPPDWCSEIKAHALAASVLTLRPSVVVEIGVWKGTSLIPMAMACREVGKGIVIGIDPWSTVASVDGLVNQNRAWWATVDHDLIYRLFMEQIVKLGLLKVVKVERKRSDDMVPPSPIDLLHVDGNHSDQAIRDVDRYAREIRTGGLCFMDDIGWEGGGVTRACERLSGMGFVKLYDLETGAMFQRIT